jgi:branched-chain amino acid transport system ATP-binding protein
MLELQNVVVDHGTLRALWDVSIDVGIGERIGLLGANGAGKSTTMGAIVGLYPVTSGAITYEGRALGPHTAAESMASGIALVPEGRRLFLQMSVLENLSMGAYGARGRIDVARQTEKVFALFPALAGKRHQVAGELSGGQQQMLAVGRALMSAPRLLLLDEPFIGVAPLLVEEILLALQVISDGGVTMILVEQNIHRALDFVSRAYVIENGRIVLAGDRESLLGDPDFSSKFLGLE